MNKLFPILLLLFVAACGGKKPPVVVPPPPPEPDRYVRVTIRGVDGKIPVNTVIRLHDDTPTDFDCGLFGERISCTIPNSVPRPRSEAAYVGQGHWTVIAPDYLPFTRAFGLTGFSQEEADIVLQQETPQLPRLVVNGQFLRKDNGEPFTVIGITQFNLLNRYINGEFTLVNQVMSQVADLGFNTMRVWTAFRVCPGGVTDDGRYCQPIGYLNPVERPDVYSHIPGFLALARRHGLYVEFTAFAGSAPFQNDDQRRTHWNNLNVVLLNETNVMLERANEANHESNKGWGTPDMYPCWEGVLTAAGSNIQDSEPVMPHCNYATYRPAGGDEWTRKLAHNGWEDVGNKYGIPTVANETVRAPDSANRIEQFYDAFRGAALLSAGATFHCVECKNSSPLIASYPLALAAAQGARSIPIASCQPLIGQYRRIDSDQFLRVYVLGGKDACKVEIRK